MPAKAHKSTVWTTEKGVELIRIDVPVDGETPKAKVGLYSANAETLEDLAEAAVQAASALRLIDEVRVPDSADD